MRASFILTPKFDSLRGEDKIPIWSFLNKKFSSCATMLIKLSVLVLLVCCNVVGSSLTPGKTLKIISKEYETNLKIESSGSKLSLSVEAKDGADANLVQFDGESLIIEQLDTSFQTSDASTPRNSLLFLIPSIFQMRGVLSAFEGTG
jgi:hypothetical protein